MRALCQAMAMVVVWGCASVPLQDCYERELRKDIELRGKIVVLFSIAPSGTAADVAIESDTFPHRTIAMCVMHVVRQWNFPFRPREPVPVAYPFVFAPAS